MALIDRFSRLFRADLHAVLDRIEEPDIVLQQAVRDMEDELVAESRQHDLLRNEIQRLDAQSKDIEQKLARIDDELNVCLEAENDDLARSTLRRRLEAEQLLQIIRRQRQQLTQQSDLLNTRLQQNRTRVQDMQQKLELLVRRESHIQQDAVYANPELFVRDEDVEVALLREKQKRRQS